MTLREVWEGRGLSATQVAAAAGITTATLYKMNRREPGVKQRNISRVCAVLEISRQDYEALDPERKE